MTSAQHVWEWSRTYLGDGPGVVAVIKAFLDESGTHGGSPVLTVGCYFATAADWRDWTKEWNLTKRPIKVFHSVECNGFTGEFEGWRREERDPLVIKLLATLTKHNLRGIISGINMDDLTDLAKDNPAYNDILRNAYQYCFQYTIMSLVTLIDREYSKPQRIAIVHEQNDMKLAVVESYDFVDSLLNDSFHKMSLVFGSKEAYTPLQAADILAYDGNHRLRAPEKPPRRSWTALQPENMIVQYLNRNNMHLLLDALHTLPPAVGREARSGINMQAGGRWMRY